MDKPKLRYPYNVITKDKLVRFIQTKTVPLVGVRTPELDVSYRAIKLPVVTVFTEVDLKKNYKGYQYVANRVRKVAKDYRGKLAFAIADKTTYSFELIDYKLEHLKTKRDFGVGINDKRIYYTMTKPFSTDALREYVEEFLGGRLIGRNTVCVNYSCVCLLFLTDMCA